MEKLKINTTDAEEKITFDEFMTCEGTWHDSQNRYDEVNVRELNYNSDCFDYFIVECYKDHTILRNRK